MTSIRKALISCVLAAPLTFLPVSSIAADKSRAADTAAARISIDNFGRINDAYFRGSQPDGDQYRQLKTLGVKTVIDLQQDGFAGEAQLVEAAGMKFVRIPMTTHDAPTSVQLDQFLRLVNDPASQPVYVHCAGGRHRTGVMTAAYRMSRDGWTAEQAFREMKAYKFGADFLHNEFKQFIYSYHPPAGAAAHQSVALKLAN